MTIDLEAPKSTGNAASKMGVVVTKTGRLGVALLLAACASALTACDDKKGPSLAPAATALASTTPPSARAQKLTIDPTSTATILLDAPKEKIKAQVTGASGTLDVDFGDLAKSRGEVKLDLTTIKTSTFTVEKDNTAQTGHARTWLEVADGEQGKIDESVKTANRYAVYAIRSIEGTTPNADVGKIAPARDGGDEVRKATLTTKGELLVHGHKVERAADVELELRYPPGAAFDKPKAVTITTRKPFVVELAEHDVKPRDGFGKLAKGSFHLLGTKVADTASVSLEIRAKPSL